jgi:hypothetical protein
MISIFGSMGVSIARLRGEAEARIHLFERRLIRNGNGKGGGGGRDLRCETVRTGRGDGWRVSY